MIFDVLNHVIVLIDYAGEKNQIDCSDQNKKQY